MLKRFLTGWLGAMLLITSSLLSAEPAHYKIVTGPERGTYIQIGQDLSKWVAQPAGIDLAVVASKGSAENVQRMRFEPGVKLALVQSDVYQAYIDMANSGNPDAGTAIRPLRLIMPLYDEEINVVVRADSPLKSLGDIRDKTISVGLLGSGTAQSATTLYRLMFGQPIPEQNIQHLSNEDALAALIVKKVDVAIIVVGQPAKLFNDMNPELLQQIRLLKAEPTAPETVRAKQTYFPATIRASSYPNWLKEDVPTLTVKAFLVTYDYGLRDTVGNLNHFADSLCANFDNLQEHGHPKWKQVKLELPSLVRGWKYYPPVEKHLRACLASRSAGINAAAAQVSEKPRSNCTNQERLLLLCK
ncbi:MULTISPECIES: TAXI family TRAP transporter solute-binding subunit [Paraburkholderia]|jgi:TRAP transporter TAXI family solute receptor|uniref:TAXI family TRAP transporter solute-binding subunit n=1 Tax=Paraburkholderia strydomiana TaxID=1245417 RepID=A0ABW9C9M4_9BURK|nr:TAXI family TRAP transporter solute-binding subunit [Paraburkholderia strydomiana]MDR7008575.1 TRAP transporter TAXI family solute receptor [Paraburkholderia strydomiana]